MGPVEGQIKESSLFPLFLCALKSIYSASSLLSFLPRVKRVTFVFAGCLQRVPVLVEYVLRNEGTKISKGSTRERIVVVCFGFFPLPFG